MSKIFFCFLIHMNLILCSSWRELDNLYCETLPPQFQAFWSKVRSVLEIWENEKNLEVNNLKQEILSKITMIKTKEWEINEKDTEINQMKVELSSNLDIIFRLEAELEKKNSEIELIRVDTRNECHLQFSNELLSQMDNMKLGFKAEKDKLEDNIVQLAQNLSNKHIGTLESKFNEMNFNFGKLVEDLNNNRNIIHKMEAENKIEVEKPELVQKLLSKQEIIEEKEKEILKLKKELFNNIEIVDTLKVELDERNQEIKNLTGTLNLILDDLGVEEMIEKQGPYSKFPLIVDQLNLELLSKEEIIREQERYLAEKSEIVRKLIQELFEKQGEINRKDLVQAELNLEIEKFKQRMTPNLKLIEELKVEFDGKVQQFNSSTRAKQEEINELGKSIKNLQLPGYKLRNNPSLVNSKSPNSAGKYFWM
jgi:hypothetical protein